MKRIDKYEFRRLIASVLVGAAIVVFCVGCYVLVGIDW